MNKLAKAKYMTYDHLGRMIGIACKCCGNVIAEQRKQGFYYYPSYTEIKIQFGNYGAHVTNLCINCVRLAQRDPDLLNAIYEADMADLTTLPSTAMLNRDQRARPKIVVVETKQRGIP